MSISTVFEIFVDCKLNKPIQRLHIKECLMCSGEPYGTKAFLDSTKESYRISLKWCLLQVLPI